MSIIVCTFLTSILFVYCASTANQPLMTSDIMKFKLNQTKKSDIVAIYGEPQSEGISGELQNACYLSLESGRKLLFVQYNDKNILVTKHFEDAKAREECGSLGNDSRFSGNGSPFGGNGSGSKCNIPDGIDQYGRQKTRCMDDATSGSRNQNANQGKNCNIPDGTDNFGRPKYRCM